jgi:hypothetical protein
VFDKLRESLMFDIKVRDDNRLLITPMWACGKITFGKANAQRLVNELQELVNNLKD